MELSPLLGEDFLTNQWVELRDFLEDGNSEKLIKEYYLGQVKYRKYGKNERVSHKQLKETSKKVNFEVQEAFCPF